MINLQSLWSSSHFIIVLIFFCQQQHVFLQAKICQVEEKLEAGQGKTAFRRFFSRFCTPIFLEVGLWPSLRCFSNLITKVDSRSAVQSGYFLQMNFTMLMFLSLKFLICQASEDTWPTCEKEKQEIYSSFRFLSLVQLLVLIFSFRRNQFSSYLEHIIL